MRLLETVMKSIWGTDAKCRTEREREEGHRLVDDAERKVDALQHQLEVRASNLDEALYQLTHREG